MFAVSTNTKLPLVAGRTVLSGFKLCHPPIFCCTFRRTSVSIFANSFAEFKIIWWFSCILSSWWISAVQRSTNWANKPTGSWSMNWVQINIQVNEDFRYMKIHIFALMGSWKIGSLKFLPQWAKTVFKCPVQAPGLMIGFSIKGKVSCIDPLYSLTNNWFDYPRPCRPIWFFRAICSRRRTLYL